MTLRPPPSEGAFADDPEMIIGNPASISPLGMRAAIMHRPDTIRPSDAGYVLFLILVLTSIGAWSPVLPPTMQQDNLRYLAVARDLSSYWNVPGIYSQRVVPCAVVWGLDRAGICDVIAGFCTVSYAAIGTFLVGLYFNFRRAGLPQAIATSATLYVLIGSWPLAYGLSNVYQACDALAYPLGLGYIMAIKSNRNWSALLIGALGLGCRQQLLVLIVLGEVAQFWTTRRCCWLIGACVHIAMFGLLVATAGLYSVSELNGVSGLIAHTVVWLPAWSTALRALYETRMPFLLSPFLLVLILHGRTTLAYGVRYWWIAAFALVTALQPLFAFDITGPENAARLAMLGLWPAAFLGGLLAGRDVRSTHWAPVFILSPLMYGTNHLVSFTAGWPSPIGHRFVVNLFVAAISAVAGISTPKRPATAAIITAPHSHVSK